jgi:hypothetical protein
MGALPVVHVGREYLVRIDTAFFAGPVNTRSHHFAGPSASRGAKTRQVVPSACRCQESRDRSVMFSATGTSSAPACAQVPARVAGEMSAPCRARPYTSEFWLRPATDRSVSSIAMKALENRPFPIAFGGPGAVTVAGTRQEQARRYRRRQSARTRTITSQSSCPAARPRQRPSRNRPGPPRRLRAPGRRPAGPVSESRPGSPRR